MYPVIFDDVLAFHDRLTVWVCGAVPVPVTVACVVEGEALLVKVNVALAAPALCGLKVTLKGTLWPARIVTGNVTPLMVNAALFELADVTVALVPLATRFPDAVPLSPSVTLPTAIVVGFAARVPVVDAPVPESATFADASEASLASVIVALNVPEPFGENSMFNATACPAATEIGRLGAVIAKYLVEMTTFLMLTVAVPVLVAFNVRLAFDPGAMLPKFRLDCTESVPTCTCCCEFPPALTPWQPDSMAIAESRRIAPAALL